MFDEATENLGYVSSAHPYGGAQRTTNVDEADIPTLQRVLDVLDTKIAFHLTIDSLSTRDDKFSVDQQLDVNQKVVGHLREVRLLVETAIEEAKEVQ